MNRLTGARMCAAERLGHDHAVPGAQRPVLLHRYVEGNDAHTGHPRQGDSAALGHINRAARAVDREDCAASLFNGALQLEQSLGAATRTRAAHGLMPEAPDDARDVFAIEAAAGEHGEPLVAPRIRRRDYAAM